MLGRAYDKSSGRGFPWTWKGMSRWLGFGAVGGELLRRVDARPASADGNVIGFLVDRYAEPIAIL